MIQRCLLALPLLTACASSPPQTGSPPREVASVAPSSVAELLGDYAAGSGLNFTYEEALAEVLEALVIEAVGPPELRTYRIAAANSGSAVGQGEFEIIELRYAVAADTAEALGQLLEGAAHGGASGERVKVLADERTNSLLVSGSPEHLERVRTLVARLDRDATESGQD